MIPVIEDIVAMLAAGDCTQEQAIAWLQQHVDNTDLKELRDGMAMAAMEGVSARVDNADGNRGMRVAWVSPEEADDIATSAYRIADAMLKERAK